jgi:6-phosphogluconolactonase/glucosamine-6-phosphate isomerase/deaminase
MEFCKGKKSKNIALSGGSTPKLLFNYLADKYSKSNIWQNI